MTRSGWFWVVVVSLAVAVVSTLSNINPVAQISGQANEMRFVRLFVSKLVNSGTVWAGLLILAGWLVRRPGQAALAGLAAGWGSLGAHYAFGQAIGIYTPEIWPQNLNWFVTTLVVGAPLGLIGAAARRPDGWGLLARLIVPVGALLEPFVTRLFVPHPLRPWPDRYAEILCGSILVAAGLVGIVWVLRSWRNGSSSLSDAKRPPVAQDA